MVGELVDSGRGVGSLVVFVSEDGGQKIGYSSESL